MSQELSPTETATSSLRDQRESNSNGFTAVNGRGSPRQTIGAGDGPTSLRPVAAEGQARPHFRDRHNSNTNGDSYRRTSHSEARRSVSPLNIPGKRKRAGSEGEKDMSDDSYDDMSPTRDDDTDAIDNYAQRRDRNRRDGPWNGRAQMDSDDMQLVEPLQREPHANGHSRPSESDGGDRPMTLTDRNEYVTTSANVQVDPKKRKRAFTNRTKTGCQTCRKRKKKCDEGKPTCNNCERGGFVCEGYTQRTAFPRTATPKQYPTPIQSKDSFPDHNSLQARPRTNPFAETPPHPIPEGIRSRPAPIVIDIDEDVPGRAVSGDWGQPVYAAGPTSRGYTVNRYPSDVPTGPFRSHIDRQTSSSTLSGGVNGMHYDVHQSPMSSLAQRGLDTLSGMNKGMTRANFQSEKEKMRHGEEFNMNDPQLVRDREQCKAALSRFNTSAASGVSSDERERQLRSILDPEGQTQQMHPATASRLGKNVTVEAPFRCDFGYSLNIRDHVLIEAGCVITDAAEVKICEGAHIGPDVKIKSRVIPRDPRVRVDRAGGQIRRAKGIRIVIEEGAYIGDGVIIAPEWDTKGGDNGGLLRIGMNSYILPGTVVRRDVPANVEYGNKERDGPDVLCGIYGPPNYVYKLDGQGIPMSTAL